ncbi:MAG TPA: aldo/keto reductase [Terriglobales bacterium]|nr:aldo/keto reductase [Terriglobales bacterium]
MRYRKLGRTALNVSEIGFGAWGIGGKQWLGGEDQAALRALRTARDNGINFYDTALAYGDGHSERLIGKAFAVADDVVIASKVPPRNRIWPAKGSIREVFPKEYVLSSLDETLRNLGRDAVDLYQFHVWTDGWAGDEEWIETVSQMKSSGKVRYIGVSLGEHTPTDSLKALGSGLVDTVQVIYNLFDQSPEDELFPYCLEQNIGVLARVPFDEGSLTGKVRPDTIFPDGDFRNFYFRGDRKQESWERVQQLTASLGIRTEELPGIALRFCLSDAAVSTVIPGMRSPEHVASNAKVSDAGPLPALMLAAARKHRWVRNYYQ